MIFTSSVPGNYSGFTLLDYLTQRFTYLSKNQWQVHIGNNRILLNGNPASTDVLVKTDDSVSFEPPPFTEPDADLNFSLIYEDEWILGVNKPGNLLVHRSGKAITHNLIYQVRNSKPEYKNVSIVNRLDKETSGVVLIAKNKNLLSAINKMFSKQSLEKTYTAVVSGALQSIPLTINKSIAKDLSSTSYPRHCIDEANGKPSKTTIANSEPLGKNMSLFTVIPSTGRTHQIRVHLLSIQCPIVGDKVYGNKSDLRFDRQALHCKKISFNHPFTNKECVVEAPLPDDMEQLIKKCRQKRKPRS